MNKKSLAKRWRYLISSLLGIVVFIAVISSCTLISFSNSDTKSLESIIANLPSAEEIRKMPLADHPRLLASEERFAEIKEQIKTDETMKQWYEKLHRHAEVLLQEKLPVYELPDGKRLANRIHSQVTTLALLYRIEQDPRYLNQVWQELEAVAEFPDWNPSHFLDTAEMTYAFAVGYDWLYDYWNEEQRAIISKAILEKGLKFAISAYQSGERWTKAEHNWNQVCNGGIGTGALAVIDEYPEIAGQALHEALKRLPDVMQHYAPDGAWDNW